MSGVAKRSSLVLLGGLAALLLISGLTVDAFFTRPRLQEVRRLTLERDQHLEQLKLRAGQDREGALLMRWLSADSLAGDVTAIPQIDPVTYIDQLLTESDLNRLELATAGSERRAPLQRTKLSVRVLGRYSRIADFMRRIERGARLAVIEAFDISARETSGDLEARFSISIYDRAAED